MDAARFYTHFVAKNQSRFLVSNFISVSNIPGLCCVSFKLLEFEFTEFNNCQNEDVLLLTICFFSSDQHLFFEPVANHQTYTNQLYLNCIPGALFGLFSNPNFS